MASIKKIALIGATGMTGRCALDTALSSGLQVRALLRPTSELPKDIADKIEIVRGDILDDASVKNTVSGADAVVFVLGTREDLSPTTLMSTGLRKVFKAMREVGIKPISIVLSSFLFIPISAVPVIFHDINEEHKRMQDAVEEVTDLDWIAIYPPHIEANDPPSEYTVAENKIPGRLVASKYDVGDFLVKSLFNPKYYGKKIGISSPEPNKL